MFLRGGTAFNCWLFGLLVNQVSDYTSSYAEVRSYP